MVDIVDEVVAIRKAAEAAKEKSIRLEAQRDQAVAVLDKAKAELQSLGCDSVEDATAEVASIRDEITELLTTINTKLQEAG